MGDEMTKDRAEQWLKERRGHVLWRAQHVPQNALGEIETDEEPSYTICCCAIGLLIVMMVVHDDDTVQLFTGSKPSEIDAFMAENDLFSFGGGK